MRTVLLGFCDVRAFCKLHMLVPNIYFRNVFLISLCALFILFDFFAEPSMIDHLSIGQACVCVRLCMYMLA